VLTVQTQTARPISRALATAVAVRSRCMHDQIAAPPARKRVEAGQGLVTWAARLPPSLEVGQIIADVAHGSLLVLETNEAVGSAASR
jgi:hypothetical protein